MRGGDSIRRAVRRFGEVGESVRDVVLREAMLRGDVV